MELRKSLFLSVDDLLVVTREFINPNATRSGLYWCLKRHGVSNLEVLLPEEEKAGPSKTFKDYEPGFVHVDVKYLPRMPDEERHGYLFAAIDRATRLIGDARAEYALFFLWVTNSLIGDARAEYALFFLWVTNSCSRGWFQQKRLLRKSNISRR